MPRILILKPSSLGDIIHALLIVQSIRRQLPGCRIVWVAREVFAPLVRASTAVDAVHLFERKGGIRAFARLLCQLRQERFDYILDMQGLARTGLMAIAAKASTKWGRADARELLSKLACQSIERPPEGTNAHAVAILAQFLPALGLKVDLGAALEFESTAAPELSTHSLLLFPDSRRPEKQWPHFAALTQQLLNREDAPTVVWAGSQMPQPVPENLAAHPRFQNRIGQTDIAQLPALVAQAEVVVANDSGPMHLAAALHRPLVALFGPTPPERFGPWPLDCPRHRVMRAPAGDLRQLAPESVAQTVDTLRRADTPA
ncbi:MAG: glycosyltransferase family 9 protein [Opitutales bacterium]